MNILHVRGGEHAVVLAREVDEEGGGRHPTGGGMGDAHGGRLFQMFWGALEDVVLDPNQFSDLS